MAGPGGRCPLFRPIFKRLRAIPGQTGVEFRECGMRRRVALRAMRTGRPPRLAAPSCDAVALAGGLTAAVEERALWAQFGL